MIPGEGPETGWAKIAQQIAEKAAKDREEKIWDNWSKVFSAHYDKASAYTRIVLTVGYAGFFTTWGFTKHLLSDVEMLASAFSMGISLVAFISWEVFTMIYGARQLNKLARVLNKLDGGVETRLENFKVAQRKHEMFLTPFWYATLTVSISSGLFAAGIVLWSFYSSLWERI